MIEEEMGWRGRGGVERDRRGGEGGKGG